MAMQRGELELYWHPTFLTKEKLCQLSFLQAPALWN